MSKQKITINATLRKDVGKGASRRLRREDSVPGVIYGDGIEPTSLTFKGNEVRKLSENEAFYSQVITMNLEGSNKKVLLKALQRNPVKHTLSHLDFINVADNTIVTISVPLHFINEDKCSGVKTQGGIISHQMTEVDLRCKAKDLPEFIEIDMKDVRMGQNIHISDLNLPKGVSSMMLMRGKEYDQVVSMVTVPRGGGVADEEGSPEAPDAPEATKVKKESE